MIALCKCLLNIDDSEIKSGPVAEIHLMNVSRCVNMWICTAYFFMRHHSVVHRVMKPKSTHSMLVMTASNENFQKEEIKTIISHHYIDISGSVLGIIGIKCPGRHCLKISHNITVVKRSQTDKNHKFSLFIALIFLEIS